MAASNYIEDIFYTLTEKQKSQIKNADTEYVVFRISVYNIGACVKLEFTNRIPTFHEDDYNSFVLETSEALQYLDKLN